MAKPRPYRNVSNRSRMGQENGYGQGFRHGNSGWGFAARGYRVLVLFFGFGTRCDLRVPHAIRKKIGEEWAARVLGQVAPSPAPRSGGRSEPDWGRKGLQRAVRDVPRPPGRAQVRCIPGNVPQTSPTLSGSRRDG